MVAPANRRHSHEPDNDMPGETNSSFNEAMTYQIDTKRHTGLENTKQKPKYII